MRFCKTCEHLNGNPITEDNPCYACFMSTEDHAYYKEKQTTKITNADKLRAMNDEELAKTLVILSERCPDGVDCESVPPGRKCFTCWLEWLKEDVEQ